MKTIFNICLVLFATISFGWCFFFEGGASEIEKNINSCLHANIISGKDNHACYDHVKVESCLNKIAATEKDDQAEVNTLLLWSKTVGDTCSGLRKKNTCKAAERFKCKENMGIRERYGDISVCKELQEVRNCLRSKLDSCADYEVEDELFEVEMLEDDCKNGNFNGGPCGLRMMMSCKLPLQVEGYTLDSKKDCDDELFKKATQCLSDLDEKCKTKDQQTNIMYQKKYLKLMCG